MMRRREFISLLGAGAAVAWPLAGAQQGERMRRIGTSEPQFPKWNRENHFAADVPSPTVG